MLARRPSLAATGALMCAALAVWVSLGALTFVETDGRGAYAGLLPPFVWLGALLAAACTVAVVVRPSAAHVAPLWLSAVLLLPWLPVRCPMSVFIWTGALIRWVWTAIAALLLVPAIGRAIRRAGVSALAPARQTVLAGAFSAIAFGWGTWAVAPQHPGGDEPHYLVITQSLLADRDLKIENNHRQGDYRGFFDNLRPDYLRRGRDGEIYSIHAPGLPVLVAPAFELSGYTGVLLLLLLLSAAASALAWHTAWLVTHHAAASWFAWAAVTLSVPFYFHATAIYPDAIGAGLMLLAVLPLVDDRAREPRALLAIGAALALLPWLHTRFAILEASAGVVLAGRLVGAPSERLKRLAALAVCPLASAIAWLAFFQIIYGEPNPAAPYGGYTQTALANAVRGLPGLLFDQQFGLVTSAPVYVCALAGLAVMLWRGPRRLGIELVALGAPYFAAVSFYFMWWGGFSAPARFLVPLTLPVAVPAAAVWYATRASAAARITAAGLLGASLLVTATITLVDRGALLFNTRDGASRLALWLSPVVDLTKALPSLFQNPPMTVVQQSAIWVAAIAIAVGVAVAVDRWTANQGAGQGVSAARIGRVVLAFGLTWEMTAMAAVALVWRSNDAEPVTPASGSPAVLRRYNGDLNQIAVAYRPFRRLRLGDLPGRLPLAGLPAVAGDSRPSRSAHLPAGFYEVTGSVIGPPEGRLRVRTDSESPPIAEWDIAALGRTWSRQLAIPVATAALELDADPAARRALGEVSLRAVSIPARRGFVADGREAKFSARYGPATVFLLDGNAWVEPGGTWIAGAASADVVIRPDDRSPIRLFVRNAPVNNQVTLQSGPWRRQFMMRSREERLVDVPSDTKRLGTPLRVAALAGARPVGVDPNTDDDRLLGVWIETR